MENIVKLFSTGQKGLSCLRGIIHKFGEGILSGVVIGVDNNVENDLSAETIELCLQHNIAHTLYPETIDVPYEIGIAAGWQRIIHDIPSSRLIIFHDSLLPKYRGFAPLVSALLNQDAQIGVTALKGESKFDTGDIYLQKSATVSYPTTIGNAIELIATLYFDIAQEIISQHLSGELTATPQNESQATYSLWRDEEDYRIDWSQDAGYLSHFVDCVGSPYRGASFIALDRLYRVHKATALSDLEIINRTPGKIIYFDGNTPIIVCGSGLLRLDHFQPESSDHSPHLNLRTRLL